MIHPRTLKSLEFDKIIRIFSEFCQSSPAREKTLAIKPLGSMEEAIKELKCFAEAQLWFSRQDQNFSFNSVPDLSGLLKHAEKKLFAPTSHFIIDLESFWAIREMLNIASVIHASIISQNGLTEWPTLFSQYVDISLPAKLDAALKRCISDVASLKDESSPELLRLRTEIRSLHQTCLRKVKDLVQQYNMGHFLQDDFMTLSSDRYVLPLKANFKGRMQGIIHDWSQTGETCYFEPVFLVEINNRLQELKHEEREEEKKILEYLTSLLLDELPQLHNAHEMLLNFDILQAKVKLAESLDAMPVDFSTAEEGIELNNARHPLLVLDRKEQKDKKTVQPLSIILRAGEKGLLITGGNAGGKTVCLKTLGLIAAMAMSGFPVPVDGGSHLPWFERIDAFIGDEQSLADNVSTFTAQIDHLARAWKHLNENGLILLDEFGSGTDPAEGAALAQAVLDGLLDKDCFFLSATHFPALKSYALSKKGVRAASMLFNPETGLPLYRIAYDQVGESQALVVAEKYGLPQSIIERARHYLLQDGENTDAIIDRLNKLANERDEELENLRKTENRLKKNYEEKTAKLEKQKEKLSLEITEKISELMHNWKTSRVGSRQTMKELSGLRKELGLENAENQSLLGKPDELKPGQSVYHTGLKKRGKITEIDQRRGKVRLDLDGVGIWANITDLRKDNELQASFPKVRNFSANVDQAKTLVLDVRGKRAEEAISEVAQFLDKTILSGFHEVEIVHGKGTGALRKEIRNFLKTFPAIEQAVNAPEDRGGDGMTIVTLK